MNTMYKRVITSMTKSSYLRISIQKCVNVYKIEQKQAEFETKCKSMLAYATVFKSIQKSTKNVK